MDIIMHFFIKLRLYGIIMSLTSFRVNPHSIVCLNVKELLGRSKYHIWNLSDSNEIQTYTYLVWKRTFNHLDKLARLASLAKWLSVLLWAKWLWIRILLLSIKLRLSTFIGFTIIFLVFFYFVFLFFSDVLWYLFLPYSLFFFLQINLCIYLLHYLLIFLFHFYNNLLLCLV